MIPFHRTCQNLSVIWLTPIMSLSTSILSPSTSTSTSTCHSSLQQLQSNWEACLDDWPKSTQYSLVVATSLLLLYHRAHLCFDPRADVLHPFHILHNVNHLQQLSLHLGPSVTTLVSKTNTLRFHFVQFPIEFRE